MPVRPLDPRHIRLVPLQLNRQGLLAEPSTLSKGSEVSSELALELTSVVRAGHASMVRPTAAGAPNPPLPLLRAHAKMA